MPELPDVTVYVERVQALLAAFVFEHGTLCFSEASRKKRASLHIVRGDDALAAFARGELGLLDIDARQFDAVMRAENHTLKRAFTDPRILSGAEGKLATHAGGTRKRAAGHTGESFQAASTAKFAAYPAPHMSTNPAPPSIRTATAADLVAIHALLTACDLPPAGLESCLAGCRLVERQGALLGCAAIEHCNGAVLMRSLAVTPAARGEGIAAALVDALQERARLDGARRLWLLTDTAVDWFGARGWQAVEREQAPAGVRAHAQFRHLCPASARLMRCDL